MQPIIDAHQHFWTLGRDDYTWLTPDLTTLYQDFQPNQLAPMLAANGVIGTVLVQAADTVAETEYLLSLAKAYPFIQGVVGWVDLSDIQSIETINRLANNPFFKGVRPMLQDLQNPNWITEQTNDQVIHCLIDNNVSIDLLIKEQHCDAALQFAQKYPQLMMVVDHAAKPNFAADQFESWQNTMASFSKLNNVYVKLSGFFESVNREPSIEECQPYIDTLLNTFTSDRIIWGSNWPVMTLFSDYQTWLNICKACLAKTSSQDQKNIFFNNALVFYRLI